MEKEKENASDTLFVQSVEKAFTVLHCFGKDRDTLSLSEVSVLTGFDKSTSQRFLHTLLMLGYLRKDSHTKRFELTPRMMQFSYAYTTANKLIERVNPYLIHLSQETNETVNLTILDDTNVVFVSRFVSKFIFNPDVIVGTRLPAYCTAPGIAMLACLEDVAIMDILDRSDIRAYTPHTITDKTAIMEKVAIARREGYACAFEETFPSDITIAAAIRDRDGRPRGAVSISASKIRFDADEAVKSFSPLVVATASATSDIRSMQA